MRRVKLGGILAPLVEQNGFQWHRFVISVDTIHNENALKRGASATVDDNGAGEVGQRH